MAEETLAQYLGRRQKRIIYWRDVFLRETNVNEEAQQEIRALLETYSTLLAKLAKTTDAAEQKTLRDQIGVADRELTSAFERRRLATSAMNKNAVATTPVYKPR